MHHFQFSCQLHNAQLTPQKTGGTDAGPGSICEYLGPRRVSWLSSSLRLMVVIHVQDKDTSIYCCHDNKTFTLTRPITVSQNNLQAVVISCTIVMHNCHRFLPSLMTKCKKLCDLSLWQLPVSHSTTLIWVILGLPATSQN